MLIQDKESKNIDMDERQNPVMTVKTLRYYCEKEGLFSTPEHNDKLYLQYKGFLKIVPETISQYHNLVALWLNNNSISKIEGLDQLIGLTSLALNNNFISRIEGLENLINLAILNLSHNKIEIVEGLDSLRKLETLNLSHNFIVNPQALEGITVCPNLSTLDLSQNQLECSEETFHQIVQNNFLACLYLKATPLSRGFKNYRKRFTAALKKLKFLDDRPILQQDHRLSEAWLKGGAEYEQSERIKIADEQQKKEAEEKQQRHLIQNQELNRPKPEGFMASIKDTSIRIMNVEDKEEEERIINQYFSREKEQVEENLRKQKEKEDHKRTHKTYNKNFEAQFIEHKVKEILFKDRDEETEQDQAIKLEKRIQSKWKQKYEPILETLLLRYKFDFGEVQPSFNMIIANVNRRLMKAPVRFQLDELRKIWTKVELKAREQASAKDK